MTSLAALWLPIVVATVAVFFVSAIMWMATPLHNKDIQAAPPELEERLRDLMMRPGSYMFPMPAGGSKDFKDPGFVARFEKGPWGVMTVWPGKPKFVLNLVRTFLVFGVIQLFVAYVTGAAFGAGAGYLDVFRIAGAAAVLGFTFGGLPNDIFFGKPSRFVLTSLFESIVYALVTAGVFAWLWPGTPVVP